MLNGINVLIQARMSSTRYPGKVLAPVKGVPLIKNLLDSVRKLKGINNVVVLTSTLESDDPLVAYLNSIQCLSFRGELENVFRRYQDALKVHSCDYFVRLCADSPFLDPAMMQYMIDRTLMGKYALISNAFSGTFPKGQSVEIIRSQIVCETSDTALNLHEKEHVMPYFYKNLNHEECLFLKLDKDLSSVNQCVDTIEDLKKINESSAYRINLNKIQRVCVKNLKGAI